MFHFWEGRLHLGRLPKPDRRKEYLLHEARRVYVDLAMCTLTLWNIGGMWYELVMSKGLSMEELSGARFTVGAWENASEYFLFRRAFDMTTRMVQEQSSV